jgi:cell wall assembly regulator SMI1
MSARSIEETIRRLERTLINEGDFKLKMAVFDRQPGEAQWPDDLPPLSEEAAVWFGTHFVSGEFLGAWRWAPWAAEVYRESVGVAGFRASLVPVLDGEPVYYLDMQDGSVWSRSEDEAGASSFAPAPFASFSALLDAMEAEYAARAGWPWRKLRVDRAAEAEWQGLEAPPDRAALEAAEVGAVILARSLADEHPEGALWLKISAECWARSSFLAPAPFDEEYLDDMLAKLRHYLADRGDALGEHAGEEAAAQLAAQVGRWRAEGPVELCRGKIRVWSQPEAGELVRRLGAALQAVAPSVRASLVAPASEAALAELEAELGRALPAGLRALWSLADGQGGEEALYLGFRFIGVARARQVVAAMRERVEKTFGDRYWEAGVLSFLERDNGEHLCVDVAGAYGPAGCVTDFDPEWPERRQILFDSVTEWLECFVDGLEAGLYVPEPELGLYPRGLLETGWCDEVNLLNEVRSNNRYPWERHNKMRFRSTLRSS